MSARTLVVVNPHSRNGATGRRWDAVERRLREALGELEVEFTRGPRDASRIAREGVRAGVQRIVVAGGDGTLSEVATGLLSAELGRYASIGLLPLGTGGDFVRSVGIPRDPRAAIETIAAGKTRPLDAGRVTYRGRDGEEACAWFTNVASFGISGLVDELVNQTTKVFGGTVSFLWGTLRALASFRSRPVRLSVDGELVHDGPLVLGAAANGQYFGGGMHIGPGARTDDGLLDVVMAPDLPRRRLLRLLPRLYAGTHLEDAAVHFVRGRCVEAESEPGAVPLELDGEPLGTLPARIELHPGALSLIGPAG